MNYRTLLCAFAASAAVTFAAGSVHAESAPIGNDGSALALNEKRLMKELTETSIADFTAHVQETCGAKLTIDVDWNSFKGDEAGLRAFNLYGLERVSGALDEICVDDLGKQGVTKGLTTYRIRNVKPDQKKVAFDSGVLTLEAGFGAEWSEGAIDQAAIKELIESKL